MTLRTVRRWRTQSLSSTFEPRRARKGLLHGWERTDRSTRTRPASSSSRKVLIGTYRATALWLVKYSTRTLVSGSTFNDFVVYASITLRATVCDTQRKCTLASRPEISVVHMKGDPQVHKSSTLPSKVWDWASKQVCPDSRSLCCVAVFLVTR
jgi:hypothetical protein